MPTPLKRNAAIVFALAVFFAWSFFFAKHDPILRNAIPFGDDPYDAVGSYAVIVAGLLSLLSIVRAFRPRGTVPTQVQAVYLIRTQQAVVLAMLLTLASDAIAMARHPALWTAPPARDRLFPLLAAPAVLALCAQALLRTAQKKFIQHRAQSWKASAIVTLLALSVLALYPEQWIERTVPHLLTILIAAVILFAPMRFLLPALVPLPDRESAEIPPPSRSRSSSSALRWAIVLLAGALIGAFAYAGEISEGSAPPLSRLLFVGSVFVGLGLGGLLLAYAFLGKPLGLAPRP